MNTSAKMAATAYNTAGETGRTGRGERWRVRPQEPCKSALGYWRCCRRRGKRLRTDRVQGDRFIRDDNNNTLHILPMIGGDVPTDVMEMMMMTAAKVMKQAFEVK
ncbi:unnamed protein product [Gadus morhua 'NCC']